MIGKPITGKSFGGCVRYIMEKNDAVLIDAEGVRLTGAAAIIRDFNMQREMRPGLGKAVGHTVLSWSKDDLPKLTDQMMVERAREYMERMNIRDTQFIIVRHNDREHPHVHIVYNRVDNNGRTISDQNNFERNVKACKEMTAKYGYHFGKGKELVNRQALRGKERGRYQLYDAIKTAVKQSTSWKELEVNLQKQGIAVQYKFRSGTSDVQGISFEMGELKMKGSAIDRAFSFSKIDAQLQRNTLVLLPQSPNPVTHTPTLGQQLREVIQDLRHSDHDQGKGLLELLLQPEFVPEPGGAIGDPPKRKKRKKKRGYEQEQSYGISR